MKGARVVIKAKTKQKTRDFGKKISGQILCLEVMIPGHETHDLKISELGFSELGFSELRFRELADPLKDSLSRQINNKLASLSTHATPTMQTSLFTNAMAVPMRYTVTATAVVVADTSAPINTTVSSVQEKDSNGAPEVDVAVDGLLQLNRNEKRPADEGIVSEKRKKGRKTHDGSAVHSCKVLFAVICCDLL